MGLWWVKELQGYFSNQNLGFYKTNHRPAYSQHFNLEITNEDDINFSIKFKHEDYISLWICLTMEREWANHATNWMLHLTSSLVDNFGLCSYWILTSNNNEDESTNWSELHNIRENKVARRNLTFAVRFDIAVWNFCLVFVPATLPTFATLVKAPFNHAAPAVTYLHKADQWTSLANSL